MPLTILSGSELRSAVQETFYNFQEGWALSSEVIRSSRHGKSWEGHACSYLDRGKWKTVQAVRLFEEKSRRLSFFLKVFDDKKGLLAEVTGSTGLSESHNVTLYVDSAREVDIVAAALRAVTGERYRVEVNPPVGSPLRHKNF